MALNHIIANRQPFKEIILLMLTKLHCRKKKILKKEKIPISTKNVHLASGKEIKNKRILWSLSTKDHSLIHAIDSQATKTFIKRLIF